MFIVMPELKRPLSDADGSTALVEAKRPRQELAVSHTAGQNALQTTVSRLLWCTMFTMKMTFPDECAYFRALLGLPTWMLLSCSSKATREKSTRQSFTQRASSSRRQGSTDKYVSTLQQIFLIHICTGFFWTSSIKTREKS